MSLLKQNSQELNAFTPQWMLNRGAAQVSAALQMHLMVQMMVPLICQLCLQETGGGAPKAQSPTSAARREEKPWVAERWTTDKDIGDSKWNHDPRWGEDERDRERLVAGSRREPARCGKVRNLMLCLVNGTYD
jgi:hypothetical protein